MRFSPNLTGQTAADRVTPVGQRGLSRYATARRHFVQMLGVRPRADDGSSSQDRVENRGGNRAENDGDGIKFNADAATGVDSR
jgi:hypothetical protein